MRVCVLLQEQKQDGVAGGAAASSTQAPPPALEQDEHAPAAKQGFCAKLLCCLPGRGSKDGRKAQGGGAGKGDPDHHASVPLQSADRQGTGGAGQNGAAASNVSRVDSTPSVSSSGVALQGNAQQSTVGLNSRDGQTAAQKNDAAAAAQSAALQQQAAAAAAQQNSTPLRDSNNIVTPPPARYLLGPLPPEDVGKKCWGEDTRILTNRGFLFLHELLALRASQASAFAALTYACYEVATRQLVYAPGELVINPRNVNASVLYSFTPKREQARWEQHADAQKQFDADSDSEHLSVRFTGTHDVYAQMARDNQCRAFAFEKVTARELADPSFQPFTPTLRMLALAADGVRASTTDDDAFERRLELTSTEQIDAFVQLYGFWLHAGSMSAAATAVVFPSTSVADAKWLPLTLHACGLQEGIDFVQQADDSVHVSKQSWVTEFAQAHSSQGLLPWTLRRLALPAARLLIAGLQRAQGTTYSAVEVQSADLRDQLLQLMLHAGYTCHFELQRAGSPLGFRACSAVPSCSPSSSSPLLTPAQMSSLQLSSPSLTFDRVERIADSWLISFADASSSSATPTMSRSEIRAEKYSGTVWCVSVEHSDHLVVVQRAECSNDAVAPASSTVTRVSRPVIAGQCLVLDLDETLVHSSFKPIPNADFVISIELESVIHRVYVRKRPGVDHFMRVVGEKFEVVIFTASLAKYADPLLDILDRGRVVKARLFREACVCHYGNYVKDLSHLGRRMEDILIVDNSPFSYMFQPDNAIPITSWFNDKSDRQLYELLPFLDSMLHVDDVSHVLQRRKPQYGSGIGVPPGV